MSIYNEIYVTQRNPRIIVDCNPDQFTRDTVSLDEDDFDKIVDLAVELGWIESRTAL